MTDKQTPPDWVLIEAAKRSEWGNNNLEDLEWIKENFEYFNPAFRALCDMIERYEQPPVDRKLLCAREAVADVYRLEGATAIAAEVTAGKNDLGVVRHAIRAIELWEEGFGK